MSNTESSRNIDSLLKSIYSDCKINNLEFQLLRDFADEKFDLLLENYGENNNLSAFQKSMDVTVQLMQQSFFDIKKQCENDDEKKIAKEAFDSQMAYIIANYERFFSNL
ncbi:hypothetical protein [Yersinia aleksiciae]|uniref:Uncharacterized protein n=1 Tax=Yersinia aleksiciae TaxID=263819 RepID=A0A0T9UXE5_YERAE|nr:hypothetical protein [Yersinia aleksiciae]AKP33345.1 hypothetical protein ACZ76_07210 [Yersinia aleksiciae]MDA5497554.1 hypothetical protein [Yersinia aleksiciae]NIK98303.1 hypothetical protein [Yersinia aleksiciae]WQC71120.1 hypothetical protein N0K21_01120 [Yersinia aleksiciae]CFQ42420.1 Uncharacterised protein [Yersinia aleksiciae]